MPISGYGCVHFFFKYFVLNILCCLVQKMVSSKIWQFIILSVLKIRVTRAYVSVVILLVLTFVLQSTCFFCPAWESRMSSIKESYFSKCVYLFIYCSVRKVAICFGLHLLQFCHSYMHIFCIPAIIFLLHK